jgi:hypothetical protein
MWLRIVIIGRKLGAASGVWESMFAAAYSSVVSTGFRSLVGLGASASPGTGKRCCQPAALSVDGT